MAALTLLGTLFGAFSRSTVTCIWVVVSYHSCALHEGRVVPKMLLHFFMALCETVFFSSDSIVVHSVMCLHVATRMVIMANFCSILHMRCVCRAIIQDLVAT